MFFVNIFISVATMAAGFRVKEGAASATSAEALLRVAAHAVFVRRWGRRVLVVDVDVEEGCSWWEQRMHGEVVLEVVVYALLATTVRRKAGRAERRSRCECIFLIYFLYNPERAATAMSFPSACPTGIFSQSNPGAFDQSQPEHRQQNKGGSRDSSSGWSKRFVPIPAWQARQPFFPTSSFFRNNRICQKAPVQRPEVGCNAMVGFFGRAGHFFLI